MDSGPRDVGVKRHVTGVKELTRKATQELDVLEASVKVFLERGRPTTQLDGSTILPVSAAANFHSGVESKTLLSEQVQYKYIRFIYLNKARYCNLSASVFLCGRHASERINQPYGITV